MGKLYGMELRHKKAIIFKSGEELCIFLMIKKIAQTYRKEAEIKYISEKS